MTPWMRKLHKWVGLLIALQFTVWMGSGLMMGLLDHDTVQGETYRNTEKVAPRAWPSDALPAASVVAAASEPVQHVESSWLQGRAVYRLQGKTLAWLVDAVSGTPVPVGDSVARSVASADYTGPGKPGRAVLMPKADLEAREHAGPIWRVPFSDAESTTLYISAQDGTILQRRNDTWRLFDIVWMLHIMDYTGRADFNNPLVITMAVGGLWMALTGIWLLFASFHWNEFVPARWRPRREVAVFGPDGTRLRSVPTAAGDSVFVALGRHGLQLPSNCGGGQSCGLCQVRFRGHAPAPTSADRAHIDPVRLKQGYRLACNLPVRQDMQVEVPGGAAIWSEQSGVIEQATALSPFLREFVIKPDALPDEPFRPGCYIQVHVPSFELERAALAHPEDHSSEWQALALPERFGCKQPIRRSYSLARPTEQAQGRITLLARFSPGQRGGKRHPPGKGSSYLYSLKPGDRIQYSGPFGDFALKPGGAEKVFIGGGAGMAPLRAMILALLGAGASERIHYWYGARNLREAPYLQEMQQLAREHANFSWHLVLSEEAEQGAGLARGMVHEATHDTLLRAHPDLQACEFYVCGPPGMLVATRKMLASLGVPEDRIAFDDFKI
jgi:Na+-transporting NADH:ubiquinone oxidoreductase subunit F